MLVKFDARVFQPCLILSLLSIFEHFFIMLIGVQSLLESSIIMCVRRSLIIFIVETAVECGTWLWDFISDFSVNNFYGIIAFV